MAISYVGSASGGTSATLPTHQTGDLILAISVRPSSWNDPEVPASTGWIQLAGGGDENWNWAGWRVHYKIAASNSETTGTWTSADRVAFLVLRGAHATYPVGRRYASNGSSTSVSYGGFTLLGNESPAGSWVVGLALHLSTSGSLGTAPSGMTNRVSSSGGTAQVAIHDTNGAVTSWSTTSASIGGSSAGWNTLTLEILSADDNVNMGSELVSNGTWTTDWSSWSISSATGSIDSGRGKLTSSGSGASATQDITSSTSSTYRIYGELEAYTSNSTNYSARLRFVQSGSYTQPSIDVSKKGQLEKFEFVYTPTETTPTLEIGPNSLGAFGASGDYAWFDNFTVATIGRTVSFTFAPSGGVAFGGSATTTYTNDYVASVSGGVAISGVATTDFNNDFTFTPSGGVTLSGTATVAPEYVTEGTDGLTLSGTATTDYTHDFILSGTGGLTLSGTATTDFTQDYSDSGSGGLVFSGAATLVVDYVDSGSGGLTFGGSAGSEADYVHTASGGLQLGGTATTDFTQDYSASGSGGLILSGTATTDFTQDYAHVASGGLTLSGVATTEFTHDFSAAGSGGLVLSGTATTDYTWDFIASGSGGLTFAGTAYSYFYLASAALSYVGSASGGTSATLPTHQTGDLIIAFSVKGASWTDAEAPAGWTQFAGGGSENWNFLGWRLHYKVAASNSETTGTWTNADRVGFLVVRGANTTAPLGRLKTAHGSSTTVMYDATPFLADSSPAGSWAAAFSLHDALDGSLGTAPTGMTNRVSSSGTYAQIAIHDTNAPVLTWNSADVSIGGTSNGWNSIVVEILSADDAVVLGSELVSNGTFGTDWSSWTIDQATGSSDSGRGKLVANAVGHSATQDITVSTSLVYRLTGELEAYSGNATDLSARVRTTQSASYTPPDIEVSKKGQVETFDFVTLFTETTPTLDLSAASFSAYGAIHDYAWFDNISIKELTRQVQFSILGSGGLVLGGSASTEYSVEYVLSGSGGLLLSGVATADYTHDFVTSGTGGLTLAGTASTDFTQDYAHTMSGGLTLSGTATTDYTWDFVFAPSGGLTFGGEAATESNIDFSATGSGGLLLAGEAESFIQDYVTSGAGGLLLSGAASTEYVPDYVHASSGGLQLSGVATTDYTQDYSFSGTGQLTFGGVASTDYTWDFVYSVSGGVLLAGAAATEFYPDYVHTSAGGLVFGGAASTEQTADYVMSGDGILTFGGEAATEQGNDYVFSGSGGLQLEGSADAFIQDYTFVPSGGVTLGGVASTTFESHFTFAPAGGLTFGGAAGASLDAFAYTGSGGVVILGASSTFMTANGSFVFLPSGELQIGGNAGVTVMYSLAPGSLTYTHAGTDPSSYEIGPSSKALTTISTWIEYTDSSVSPPEDVDLTLVAHDLPPAWTFAIVNNRITISGPARSVIPAPNGIKYVMDVIPHVQHELHLVPYPGDPYEWIPSTDSYRTYSVTIYAESPNAMPMASRLDTFTLRISNNWNHSKTDIEALVTDTY